MGWPGFSSNGQADPSAANSRPKSAGITGTTGNVGGLMSSLTGAGRPSSGGAANNWGPVGGAAPQQGQQQQMAGAQNSSNTLSYGSLKNRFLSGSAGGAAGAPKANGAAPISSAAGGSGMSGGGSGTGSGNKSSSKLFSLAR